MGNRFNHPHPFGTKISSRKFFAVAILVSGTLAWFLLIQMYFLDLFAGYSVDASWIYLGLLLFYAASAFSAIVGSSVSERVNRKKMIYIWIISGVLATSSLTLFKGEFFVVLLSLMLGVSFGFGFPSSAAFLADSTVVEERAKISGAVILTTFLLTFLSMMAIPALGFGITGILLFLAALRATSLLGLALDKCDRERAKTGSWFSILSYRDFASYVVPWILFNTAAGLLMWWNMPQTSEFISVKAVGIPLAFVCIAVFGFVAGFVADRFGRRQPIIISFVMLGVSLALLSFILSPLTMLIYYVTYGVAWGFLFTLYLAVPGDLSYSGSREKFYALGTMAPLIVYMGLNSAPDFLSIRFPASILSPVLSIIIFLSVIPVLRASETLPENITNERKLKKHIEKVGKLVEESKKSE